MPSPSIAPGNAVDGDHVVAPARDRPARRVGHGLDARARSGGGRRTGSSAGSGSGSRAQCHSSMSTAIERPKGIASSARWRTLTERPGSKLPEPRGWAWNGAFERLGPAPGVAVVVLGARAEVGGEGLTVDRDLLVALAPPGRGAVEDLERVADVDARALHVDVGHVLGPWDRRCGSRRSRRGSAGSRRRGGRASARPRSRVQSSRSPRSRPAGRRGCGARGAPGRRTA